MMKRPSLIERLTGSFSASEYEDDLDDALEQEQALSDEGEADFAPQEDGELPIDMYQTPDKVVIRALIAGVSPDDLDIAITRDMVTIKGHREEDREAADDGYYHRELYWGGFSRTILLPEEILIDEADAREKHGFLEIILPKVDKERTTKLKVKVK